MNPRPSPGVVVAMPTFNHGSYLKEAVESVLAQTFLAWELVIVNDGSTDQSSAIIRGFEDPRIRVVARAHQGLAGLGAAYGSVLELSSAPLVAILEGDDRWPPDKLQRQVADFDDPQVVLSYGAGWLIDECGCEYGRVAPFPPEVRENRPVGAIVPRMMSVNPILSPTVVVRRSSLASVGGFWQPDGVPYVDHPTWLLLAMEGAFAYHDEPVGSWRRHPAQWTTQVVADTAEAPEAAYLDEVADRYVASTGRRSLRAGPDPRLVRPHADRATSNRWRLALLAASPGDIARMAARLIRSGNPRSIGLALLGLAMRAVGSDLEWLQLRRGRVAWPSRRHKHIRPCPTSATGPGPG